MQTVIFVLAVALSTGLVWTSPLSKIRNGTIRHEHASTTECGTSNYVYESDTHDRIIGGRFAEPGEFPWMVSLREKQWFSFEHVCGASILNKYWIVTAAHCFISFSPSMYEVGVGLHEWNNFRRQKSKIHKIAKIISHAKYNDETNENDIALIKTVLPIDIEGSEGNINQACRPEKGSDPRGYAYVSGWGHTVENGRSLSTSLKTAYVPIVPRYLCNQAYDQNPFDNFDEITEGMICAGATNLDSCQYDSGGPLMQIDKDDVTTIVGVVSFGRGCGQKYYPGVYTRLAYYHDWIEENTK